MPQPVGPLDGVKVVACSTAQAGSVPYMLMADQAAANGEDGGLIQSHAAECDAWAKKALKLDAGNPDGATTHDVEGTRRDALPDVGAYEYADN